MYCLAKFCHICMTSGNSKLTNLKFCNMQKFNKKLHFSVPEVNNNAPEFICRLCYKKIQRFYKFKCMLIQNSKILNKYQLKLSSNIATQSSKSVRGELYISVSDSNENVCKQLHTKVAISKKSTKACDVNNVNLIKETSYNMKNGEINTNCISQNDNEDFLGFHTNDLINSNNDPKSNSIKKSEEIKQFDMRNENSINNELGFDKNDIKFSAKQLINVKEKVKVLRRKYHVENIKKLFDETMSTTTTETQEKYKCTTCYKHFAIKSTLLEHIATHKTAKSYKCNACNKKFTSRTDIDKHVLVHAGQYHICSICNKLFSQKSNLGPHFLTHFGQKPFKCSVCDKSFVLKENLDEHRLVHAATLEKYKCVTCMKIYSSSHSLKRHILTHSNSNQFKCDKCNKTFIRRSNLTRHNVSHNF